MLRKLAIGTDYRFRWTPPRDEGLATLATLTVSWPTGTLTYDLEGRESDTVTAVSADRRRITVTYGDTGPIESLMFSNPAPVYLQNGAFNQVPCRVIRLVSVEMDESDPPVPVGGVLELAEQLPVGVITGGTLEWLTLSADIELADIPATPVRAVRWQVAYTSTEWGQAGTGSIDRGTLAVVHAPFATGLTDASMARIAPWTSTSRPAGQSSWADQIDAGLDLLVSRILPNLAEGTWEDDLVGEPWLRAHALATQIVILQDLQSRGVDRTAALEEIQKEFIEEIKNRMARPEWIDLDSDDVIDPGEGAAGVRAATTAITSHVTDGTLNASDSDSRFPLQFTRTRIGDAR